MKSKTRRKPNIKYDATLTGEKRDTLEKPVRKDNTAGYRIRRPRILLAPDGDGIPANGRQPDERIAAAYGTTAWSLGVLEKRFGEAGFEAAPERKKRLTPPEINVDGEAGAKIVALTRGTHPVDPATPG